MYLVYTTCFVHYCVILDVHIHSRFEQGMVPQ